MLGDGMAMATASYQWGLAFSRDCESGTTEETANRVLTACPTQGEPQGARVRSAFVTMLDQRHCRGQRNRTAQRPKVVKE